MSAKTTTFRSRGRLAGLIRDEAPAGTGQNRASRAHSGERQGLGEALHYRARLILGDSLAPAAELGSGARSPRGGFPTHTVGKSPRGLFLGGLCAYSLLRSTEDAFGLDTSGPQTTPRRGRSDRGARRSRRRR